MSTTNTVPKKMALEMLILKKSEKNTDTQINQLVRSLPEPLKNLVSEELKKMRDMSLEELNYEFNNFKS